MSIVLSDLAERLGTLTKLVLAEPVARIGHSRVTVRPLTLRGKAFFQLEYQQGQIVSKTLAQNRALSMTLFAFEQDEAEFRACVAELQSQLRVLSEMQEISIPNIL